MAQQIRPIAWNFEVPDANKLLQPIMQGWDAGVADKQRGIENQRQNKLLGFREQEVKQSAERFGLDKQRSERDAEKDRLTMLGKSAAAIHQMPDGPEKAARAQALLAGHQDLAPQFSKYGVNLSNPTQAVGFLAQSWGEYDPLAVKAKQAQIAQSQASAAASARDAELFPHRKALLEAQARQAGTKDEMGGLITGMVRGALGGQQGQSAPPAATLQPQSYGGPQGGGPNLIPVQAAGGQPQPPPSGSMFDGKTPQEKRRIGEALLLDPRTKALGEQLVKDAEKDGLGTTAKNDIDEKIVSGLDQVSRLEAMNQTFQDKYQTIGTRLKMTGTGWLAKIDPSKVSPQDAKDLTDFAKDRRRGIENLNLTIKDITGAAMSNPEAARIMQQVPNPGTGIFDGDDPVTYRAKMQDALNQTRLAIIRRAWLKKNNPQLLEQLAGRKMEGIENAMPLDRMRDMMNERKNQIYQQLKQRTPNATREQLLPFVGQQLNQEFGI